MTRTTLAVFTLGVILATGTAKAEVTPDALCKEKKAKAAGKEAFDVMKAFGKNIRKPDTAKLAQNISKAKSKLTKGFVTAEGKGDCGTTNDSDAIEAKVNALVLGIVTDLLACGDDLVNREGEECDGTDDSACPGNCIQVGGAGGICGDNLLNGGNECTCAIEECDGTEDSACPGECWSPGAPYECRCPFCGDHSLNVEGEECDGTDDAACPGICQGNCRCPEPACGNGVVEVGEECEPPCSEDPPCGSGTICGVTCECLPIAPCNCGTPAPPTTLVFETEIQGGICGAVKDAGDVTLVDLQCATSYVGGGVLGIAPAETPIPVGASLHKVECCYGTSLALTSYGPADTGSIRNCTKAGCLLGAPIPVPIDPAVLSICVLDLIVEDTFGSADCSTGVAVLESPVEAPVHLSGDVLRDRCSGGPNPGGSCSDDSDCAGGTCLTDPTVQPCPICNSTTLTCNGGPNDGLACTPGTPEIGPEYPTSHDCPPNSLTRISFSLQPLSLTTGTASKQAADGHFCGFCRDVEAEGSLCFEGDADPGQVRGCPDSTIIACEPATGGDVSECGIPIPCNSHADCYAPYESCEQRNLGAADQPTATAIIQTGSPGGDLSDRLQHAATLVSVHCAPPTLAELTDAGADFPGPGTTSMPGRLQLLP